MIINDWFVGIVEDVNDPTGQGRVRVRCLGYHTPDRTQLPTIDLPLATVMLPTTSASVAGIGISATALVPNTWVFGFFRDGQELQDPVVVATIASASGYDVGFDVTSNMGYGDPHKTFGSFLGNDIPPEAGTLTAPGASTVMNSYGAGSTATGVYSNAIPITTSFDSTQTPPTIAGGAGDKLAAVAENEYRQGIIETSDNQGPGIQKYWSATEYPGGYSARQAWCAAFASWCIRTSGVLPETARPKTAKAFGFEEWAVNKPYAQLRFNPRYVKRGDIVTFAISHVGIANSDSDANGNYTSIDGNTVGNRVNIRKRSINNTRSAITIIPSA